MAEKTGGYFHQVHFKRNGMKSPSPLSPPKKKETKRSQKNGAFGTMISHITLKLLRIIIVELQESWRFEKCLETRGNNKVGFPSHHEAVTIVTARKITGSLTPGKPIYKAIFNML